MPKGNTKNSVLLAAGNAIIGDISYSFRNSITEEFLETYDLLGIEDSGHDSDPSTPGDDLYINEIDVLGIGDSQKNMAIV